MASVKNNIDPELRRAREKRYRDKNKEVYQERVRIYKQNNIPKYLLASAKNRARSISSVYER